MKQFMIVSAALCSAMVSSLWADKLNNDDGTWEYTTDNYGRATLVTFAPATGVTDVSIPASFDNKKLTTIGKRAFKDRTTLKSITIPASVTTIGGQAFYACSSLETLTIPEGVKAIEERSFGACSSLKSVSIPATVTKIGAQAFSDCVALTYIDLPNGITYIEQNAFQKCTSLTSVTLPAGISSIGMWAFYNCTNLSSVVFLGYKPDIGNDAFKGIAANASATYMPDFGYSFDGAMIAGLTLKKLTSSGTVTQGGIAWKYTLNQDVITDQETMTINGTEPQATGALTIPATLVGYPVTTISEYAFANYSSLTAVTIPEGVDTIGAGAFYLCRGLTAVTLPASVTKIEDGAFTQCAALTTITVAPDNTAYRATDGVLFTADQTLLVQYPAGKLADTYAIPASVTVIGGGAFAGSRFTSMTIPATVKTIEISAFMDCSDLAEVTFLGDKPTIGDSAFASIAEGAIGIYPEGNTTWQNPSVDGLAMQSTGGSIAINWLYDIDPNTETVTITGTEPAATGDITIPATLDGKPVTAIGNYAFSESIGLTSVTIPASISEIGESAFYACSGLTSVTIPEGVTTIGENAFSGCSGLSSMTIPASVSEIGAGAFSWCSGLTSVTIPEGVTTIGTSAFSGCESLTSVTIPASVTKIEGGVFAYCVALHAINLAPGNKAYRVTDGVLFTADQTLLVQYPAGKLTDTYTIPASVTVIGGGAFAGSRFTSMTIPATVKTIDQYAFMNCDKLAQVDFLGDRPEIGLMAFLGIGSSAIGTYLPGKTGWKASEVVGNGLPMQEAAPAYPEWVPGVVTHSPELKAKLDSWLKGNEGKIVEGKDYSEHFLLGIAPDAEPVLTIKQLTVNEDGSISVTFDQDSTKFNGSVIYRYSNDLKDWTAPTGRFIKAVIIWPALG